MSALSVSSLVCILITLIIYQKSSNILVNGVIISVVFESMSALSRISGEK